MADLPTIVVAGYGAWASAEVNPASQVLENLSRRDWANCRLITIEVPVVSGALYERVERALLEVKPAAWIGLGVNTAADAAIIRAEKMAINWRHFNVPDNAGFRANMEPVVDAGPAAYSADFPNEAIVDALKVAGIPAAHSFHCGTHMCNQMLYTSRHIAEVHGLNTRCGFIHVPRTTEFVAKHSWPEDPSQPMVPEIPSMGLEMMSEAVAIAVDHVSGQVCASTAAA